MLVVGTGADEVRTTFGQADDASVESVARADAALDLLDADQHVDCVVTEADLPDGTGLGFAADVRKRDPDFQ